MRGLFGSAASHCWTNEGNGNSNWLLKRQSVLCSELSSFTCLPMACASQYRHLESACLSGLSGTHCHLPRISCSFHRQTLLYILHNFGGTAEAPAVRFFVAKSQTMRVLSLEFICPSAPHCVPCLCLSEGITIMFIKASFSFEQVPFSSTTQNCHSLQPSKIVTGYTMNIQDDTKSVI